MPPPPPSRPHDSDASDRDLVRRVQEAGATDRAAWAALVERFQDRLFAVCVRMVGNRDTAADLTQDAFVKVIQGLDSYDGRSSPSTWLIRVTMNVCLSHLRSQRLRRHASLDAVMEGGGEGEGRSGGVGGRGEGRGRLRRAGGGELSGGPSVEPSERHRAVAAALASLEPDQRAILILRDVQGLEYEQIAHALDIAVGTVKSRLFRSRLALREAVERLEGTTTTKQGSK